MRLFVAILILAASTVCHGATITAVDPGPVAVSNAMQLVSAGDTLAIPAGTSNWTYGIAWSAPSNVTVRGAGTSVTGGGGQTVIVDNSSSVSPILRITIPGAGVFRFTGISMIGGSGGVKDQQGMFSIIGSTSTVSQVRIDHCTFDSHTYSPELSSGSHLIKIYDSKGVIDHCYIKLHANTAPFFYRSGVSGVGDEVWAAATAFGSDDFVFLEDNIIIGGEASLDASSYPSRAWDSNSGGKNVLRFNELFFCSGGESHATGHAGNDRGGRAYEAYGNLFHQGTNQVATSREANTIADAKSGTGLIWGNTIDAGAIKSFASFNTTRKDSATYTQLPSPWGFGFVGPAPPTNMVVDVDATFTNVTWVSGPKFNLNWSSNTMIWITNALGIGIINQEPGPSPSLGIYKVNSDTSITLCCGGATNGPLSSKNAWVGSPWDGNTDGYGYPAMDQAGRGAGDLITGVHPNKINSVSGIISWPNQALEPVYFWRNSGTPVTVDYSNGSSNLVVAQRDFYPQASGIQTSPTSPFDGTTGVGWGTLANRPTTCTPGVAYWATDQGSWNESASNPYGVQQNGADGVLYVATATDTWTLYYTPYTYPHPLNVSEASLSPGRRKPRVGKKDAAIVGPWFSVPASVDLSDYTFQLSSK